MALPPGNRVGQVSGAGIAQTTQIPEIPKLLIDDASRVVYSTDNSVYQVVPEAIGLPQSAAEVATLLRRNAQAESPSPVVARGGGTCTNGQSLTDGLVIDLKRNLGRVLSLHVDDRVVVVESGIVAGDLNRQLAPHGLFWPPHTSTLNRATVGGMISTDAAGKGSLVHGRAHRHVIGLQVVLADGTPWVAESVTIAEAERRANGHDSGARLWRGLLDLEIDEDTVFDLPELARGFSGYGIDRLRRDGLIDPTALLCGAEGTLAVITAATLRLRTLPGSARLVVASYDSFDAALKHAVDLRSSGPAAIEAFDETTLGAGRGSPAWPALAAMIGDHKGAVLLLEYQDDSRTDAEMVDQVTAGGRCTHASLTSDSTTQASIWKIRADAVGLLAKVTVGEPERSARPTAFVEDAAVPVAEMAGFIANFRRLLDAAGLVYAMFGHADVGCVHVRPALDLTQPDDRARLTTLTEQVSALVRSHGGVLWGEHGRGFRGAGITEVIDSATHHLMRQVKTAFDPDDRLNPGKLYRPLGSDEPLVGVDMAPTRGERDANVAVDIRRTYGDAFGCNGNGLCQQYSTAQVMCPSYKATGDPALSPNGRADLIREWLGSRRGDPDFEAELGSNLGQCLSCSACRGHCPVAVDVTELKSRVLAELVPPGRSIVPRLLSRFEQAAVAASFLPALARGVVGVVGPRLGLVDLPVPSVRRFRHRRFRSGRNGYDIVILPDVFTQALEADTLRRTVRVLELTGASVAVAGFIESGKFDHVKGNRARFGRIAQRQQILLRQVLWNKATPMVIEPAVALLHRHEYPAFVDDYLGDAVRTLPEVLAERADQIPSVGNGRGVTLLGHCTERSTAPGQMQAWVTVLEAAGFNVAVPEIGCCGMAGIFGHEVANQQMSRQLWDLSWAVHADRNSLQDEIQDEIQGEMVVATGYSCRSQSARFGTPLAHPIALLAD